MQSDPPPAIPSEESPAWEPIDGLWQPVWGGFYRVGVSIEWHEFSLAEPLDWARSFHPGSLEICLNFSGSAQLQAASGAGELQPKGVALYTHGQSRPAASRAPGQIHRFMTLEFNREFLQKQLESVLGGLLPEVRHFLEHGSESRPVLRINELSSSLMHHKTQILNPPVHATARPVWFQSKILEVLAQVAFQPEPPAELFCHRHRRINQERIERVRFILERDYENPPTLEMLAQEVDCSPFYLSRLFAQETGTSIPKFIRLVRMERAAALLREGKTSVTDAAMAVGYSSLSAFNKAFVEQFGVCPGLYPLNIKLSSKKAAARARS